MPEVTVTMALEVKDKLCLDLLTTAFEGGSAYWLACKTRERDAEGNVTKIIGCRDAEDKTTKWPDADLATMRLGIQKILNGDVAVAKNIRADVLAAVLDDDNTSWDAETADCVLQAGLLGSIVYG
jgi:hypothetical protein